MTTSTARASISHQHKTLICDTALYRSNMTHNSGSWRPTVRPYHYSCGSWRATVLPYHCSPTSTPCFPNFGLNYLFRELLLFIPVHIFRPQLRNRSSLSCTSRCKFDQSSALSLRRPKGDTSKQGSFAPKRTLTIACRHNGLYPYEQRHKRQYHSDRQHARV